MPLSQNSNISIIESLYDSLVSNSSKNAFCIDGKLHSYKDLLREITDCRRALRSVRPNLVGVVAHDDLKTYAGILAIWFEGKAYLPINPGFPTAYNENLAKTGGIQYFIDSTDKYVLGDLQRIHSIKSGTDNISARPAPISDGALAYLLFTSGSTSSPKGVPITWGNIRAFIEANEKAGIKLSSNDRCLQMFDLSFDLSIVSFLMPLLSGACVYTIPHSQIRYAYILKLLRESKLTFALMVPSVLSFLNRVVTVEDVATLRQSLFCGEALSLQAAENWRGIAKNAIIYNVYGPTEATIYCTCHKLEKSKPIASHNGLVCIGQKMHDLEIMILNGDTEVAPGEIGELCLSGKQVMKDYWNSTHEDAFYHTHKKRFYRTGDLVIQRSGGRLFFIGRADSQVKVNGFRVELHEVEHRIKMLVKDLDIIVYDYQVPHAGTSLALVIESPTFETVNLRQQMAKELPPYMMPSKIGFMDVFPLNTNGKKDRKKLKASFEEPL